MIQNAANFIKFLSTALTIKLMIATNSPHDIDVVFTVYMCVGYTNMQLIINSLSYLGIIQSSFDNI